MIKTSSEKTWEMKTDIEITVDGTKIKVGSDLMRTSFNPELEYFYLSPT